MPDDWLDDWTNTSDNTIVKQLNALNEHIVLAVEVLSEALKSQHRAMELLDKRIRLLEK